MARTRQIPFVRMRPPERQRLALTVLALFAVFYLVFSIAAHGIFDYVAADYRAFVSSADIARDNGLGAVYDLSIQGRYQLPTWLSALAERQQPFDVSPMTSVGGMIDLAHLIGSSASLQGVASNFPESMMNWRAIAANIADVGMPQLGRAIAVPGMLVTFAAGLALWVRRPQAMSADYARIWLGTFAATSVIAWHSHVHTALVLVAPAIFVLAHASQSRRALNLWLYLPTLLFLHIIWLGIPAAAVIQTVNVSLPRLAHIFSGIVVFGANLGILVWLLRTRRHSPDPGPSAA